MNQTVEKIKEMIFDSSKAIKKDIENMRKIVKEKKANIKK